MRAAYNWSKGAPGLILQSTIVEQNAEIIRNQKEIIRHLDKSAHSTDR